MGSAIGLVFVMFLFRVVTVWSRELGWSLFEVIVPSQLWTMKKLTQTSQSYIVWSCVVHCLLCTVCSVLTVMECFSDCGIWPSLLLVCGQIPESYKSNGDQFGDF